jgi:hypothetical protein
MQSQGIMGKCLVFQQSITSTNSVDIHHAGVMVSRNARGAGPGLARAPLELIDWHLHTLVPAWLACKQ